MRRGCGADARVELRQGHDAIPPKGDLADAAHVGGDGTLRRSGQPRRPAALIAVAVGVVSLGHVATRPIALTLAPVLARVPAGRTAPGRPTPPGRAGAARRGLAPLRAIPIPLAVTAIPLPPLLAPTSVALLPRPRPFGGPALIVVRGCRVIRRVRARSTARSIPLARRHPSRASRDASVSGREEVQRTVLDLVGGQVIRENPANRVAVSDQVIRENPAGRGTETSAEVLVGPARADGCWFERRSTAVVLYEGGHK